MDVVAGLTNAIGIVSRIREISKNIEQAEFKNLLADLSMELADAKLQVVGLKEQVAELQQRNSELARARPENKQKPKLKWGCYQFEGEEGLFCTACYDTKGVKSQTSRVTSRFRLCPVCNATLG
jgi:hypothetical protein